MRGGEMGDNSYILGLFLRIGELGVPRSSVWCVVVSVGRGDTINGAQSVAREVLFWRCG